MIFLIWLQFKIKLNLKTQNQFDKNQKNLFKSEFK